MGCNPQIYNFSQVPGAGRGLGGTTPAWDNLRIGE
jgi:hypothetical protein